jgi:hypothetical protein
MSSFIKFYKIEELFLETSWLTIDRKLGKSPKYLIILLDSIISGKSETTVILTKWVFGVDPLDLLIKRKGVECIISAEVTLYRNGYTFVLVWKRERGDPVHINIFLIWNISGLDVYNKVTFDAKKTEFVLRESSMKETS